MTGIDVVVIGGGTAGTEIAVRLAEAGKSVTLVEAGLVGGESPYLACAPMNSLLASARRGEPWELAVAKRDAVTGGLDDGSRQRALTAAGVSVLRGTARITGPGEVTVGSVTLNPEHLVIATGSEPIAPPIEGLTDVQPWTTAEALSSHDLPRRLVILGGGPSGCELAQSYAAFGSQVILAEAEERLLPAEPAFAGERLAAALRRCGVDIRLGSPATKAERLSSGIAVALADGSRIEADRVLLATGRRPRLSGLGLDALGLPADRLTVDAGGRVAEGVWAAGDCTGSGHRHIASYQARVVAACIAGEPAAADYRALPRVVNTTPAVYAVGATSGRTAGADSPGDAGQLELYADPESGILVGAAAIGVDVADWMAEITVAIRAEVPVAVLADVVHASPTHGEMLEAPLRTLASGS
jgi:pyruvate/2-oxoglutarate dehydrogenase complex dihydrolipoamide dehydrogenase (E3) component